MGQWWVNAIAGIVCLALGINFIAQAYGLRLGGKPWDISHLKVTDPRQVIDVVPLTQNNGSLPEEYRNLRGTIRLTHDVK